MQEFVLLKYYCNCNKVCAFVGVHCNSCIILHGMENVKLFCALAPF
jgi:hypothetical protein